MPDVQSKSKRGTLFLLIATAFIDDPEAARPAAVATSEDDARHKGRNWQDAFGNEYVWVEYDMLTGEEAGEEELTNPRVRKDLPPQ